MRPAIRGKECKQRANEVSIWEALLFSATYFTSGASAIISATPMEFAPWGKDRYVFGPAAPLGLDILRHLPQLFDANGLIGDRSFKETMASGFMGGPHEQSKKDLPFAILTCLL